VEFCFSGVQFELEYIAWALASNAGRLSFTSANNAAVATEFDLDYQVEGGQLLQASAPFANAATADVIGTVAAAVEQGRKNGASIRHAFMNLRTFYQVATSDQIIKQCASYAQNLTGTSQTPDLAGVNAMLARQAWCNGVQIAVIDREVARELSDGTVSSANPFADDRIVFSEGPVLGSTQYDVLRDSAQVVLRAERAHTVVKKYSTPEPLVEVTLAEADALPVLDTAYRNVYVRTDGSGW